MHWKVKIESGSHTDVYTNPKNKNISTRFNLRNQALHVLAFSISMSPPTTVMSVAHMPNLNFLLCLRINSRKRHRSYKFLRPRYGASRASRRGLRDGDPFLPTSLRSFYGTTIELMITGFLKIDQLFLACFSLFSHCSGWL